jgi:hypothetical protein
MHLSHEILYVLIAFLAGSLIGTVFGFCLFGAWMGGWIFPATVPEYLATNDVLSKFGKARSRVKDEPPFAGVDEHIFTRDEIGSITYIKKPRA